MASRKLVVEIVGDARSLDRAFKKSTVAAGKFEASMKGTRKGAAASAVGLGALTRSYIGVTAAAGGLALAAKASFSELFESQKVAAQTEAVLRSTGYAARVSADDVDTLGTSLMNLSGVDDEAIKRSENLLLTFRNIRNEVGPTNDIFNQATKATLDLSVAMGTDLESAAIRIGKALNDPVTGLTALRRVGVQFTEAQEAQIKALVKSGDTLEAQKIILRELNAEFGGSAEAAGETLPGELNKLRESARNLGATVANIATPALVGFTETANDLLVTIQKLNDPRAGLPSLGAFFKGLGERLPAGVETIPTIGPFLGALRGAFKKGGEDAAAGFTEGFAQAVAESPRMEAAAARAAALVSGKVKAAASFRPTVEMRNQWFDARVVRQLDRLQDQGLRRQLAQLRQIAAVLRARIAVTKDLTRRLNLEDKLLDVLRQQRSVQAEIADQIRAANEALKDRAEAIKSAILDRLQRRQTDILNKRALADAKEQLRIARQIGGPEGIKQALRALQDVRFDIERARLEAAPATLTRGGRFRLGDVITINVHGAESPEAVAQKVAAILERRRRRSTTQQRGPAAGSTAGQK